jgi:hypothetical protein
MRTLLFTLAILMASSLANAATFSARMSGDTATIQMDGMIVSGDALRVANTLNGVGAARTIVFNLNSPGGNVGEATTMMKGMLALRLKGWHVNVAIDQGSLCASACMLLFAAGERKFAFGEVSICVHQVRVGPIGSDYDQETPNAEMTLNIAAALRKLGAPLSVVAKQVLDDGTCTNLSADELSGWGVITAVARN